VSDQNKSGKLYRTLPIFMSYVCMIQSQAWLPYIPCQSTPLDWGWPTVPGFPFLACDKILRTHILVLLPDGTRSGFIICNVCSPEAGVAITIQWSRSIVALSNSAVVSCNLQLEHHIFYADCEYSMNSSAVFYRALSSLPTHFNLRTFTVRVKIFNRNRRT
jgi:hypothetical protein